ncbi:MAG: GHMP family kinase ATP-binding protein [Polyangiales bacterium]
MIISRTPVRVSFLGGGTDYPAYFREHGGQTLGVSIDKYSYLTVNRMAPLFDYSIRISYSRTELANDSAHIEHPSVRECLRFLGIEGGLEVNYVGDLPARTGLGSSSSFTVGLLHALHAFKGELVSRAQLAAEAVHVEQELIKERVGVQDQYTCAHGGLVHLQYGRDGSIRVSPVALRAERLAELEKSLMLFYTGITRKANDVLDEQLERTKQGSISADLKYIGGLVDQGLEVLASERPLTGFGEILHDAWLTKRKLSSKITSSAIDAHYDRARGAGAIGGKLLGAGGGGFLLVLARPEDQPAVEAALAGLPRVRFSFDFVGSSLLFYQPSR